MIFEKLTKGDLLKSIGGDWHEILKIVDKEGYIQNAFGGISVQSRNEEKTKCTIYLFDGQYLNKRSIEDVEKMYIEIATRP